MRQVLAATLVGAVVLVGPAVAAQSGGATLDVPAGAGSWVLQVITRGGIMGQGTGDFAITSEGRFRCVGQAPKCASAVAVDTMRDLLGQVRRASAASWSMLTPSTICMDCVTTQLVLTSRDGDGMLSTMRASWDPTTRGKLPDDVARLHDMTASLRRTVTLRR
jgi:hypothetical protein